MSVEDSKQINYPILSFCYFTKELPKLIMNNSGPTTVTTSGLAELLPRECPRPSCQDRCAPCRPAAIPGYSRRPAGLGFPGWTVSGCPMCKAADWCCLLLPATIWYWLTSADQKEFLTSRHF